MLPQLFNFLPGPAYIGCRKGGYIPTHVKANFRVRDQAQAASEMGALFKGHQSTMRGHFLARPENPTHKPHGMVLVGSDSALSMAVAVKSTVEIRRLGKDFHRR